MHKNESLHDNEFMQTRVSCTLCDNEFTTETIKVMIDNMINYKYYYNCLLQDHLKDVHMRDATNWKSYIKEVEFEIDIEPEVIS